MPRRLGIFGLLALVAQWIEQWFPKPCAEVRFFSGARLRLDDAQANFDRIRSTFGRLRRTLEINAPVRTT